MVDREQNQARLLTDVAQQRSRTRRDLGIALGAVAIIAAVVVVADVPSALIDWVDGLSNTARFTTAGLLVVSVVLATVYTVRRYHDIARTRDRFEELAGRDHLTGLPNRRFLGEGFEELLRQARRYSGHIAVFFVGLDGLKRVNDLHGPDVGDDLMVAVANRLRGTLTHGESIVRYGGGEFVVLCAEITSSKSAERLAQAMIASLESPFTLGDRSIRISACVGIVLTEQRCTHPDEVLRDADAAMFRARAAGAGRWALFDRSLHDRITPSTAERRLREALAAGEFRLYYQPIVSLWTKRLVGVEALLRWEAPDQGMISPEEFVPALEDTGLIVPVGTWVLDEVCRQSRRWQDQFPDRPPLNIKTNVSARQLAQPNFMDVLRECLGRSGVSADRICLEVSEGALMHDPTSAASTLLEAKKLGISLALDDFGTGYSSLAFLSQFRLDLLKIDNSFVDGLLASPEDATIVEHVIGMAKALGIVTVAEGVQTEEQVERLREMSCDLAQGYYFSHPQPPDVITHLLDQNANPQEWRPTARANGDERSASGDADAPTVVLDHLIRAPGEGARTS